MNVKILLVLTLASLILAVVLVNGLRAVNRTEAVVLAHRATSVEPYTVTLHYDWSDYVVIRSTEVITYVSNMVTVELRDPDGTILETQSKSIPDCEPHYLIPAPEVTCGSPATFDFVLDGAEIQEWGKASFYFVNSSGEILTYDVPVLNALSGPDERGFCLMNAPGEWYDTCPVAPPPLPTSTPWPAQPTYTPAPTPTCRPVAQPTYTPMPTPTFYPTNTPWPVQP